MTNRVGRGFLFEYMNLRDQGLTAAEIEAAALDPIDENWEQTFSQDESDLTATLAGRIQTQDAEAGELLDEAAQIDITRAALDAIEAHKAICQQLEEKGEELTTLLQNAEKEQRAMHQKKQSLNQRLQNLRCELYNGSPNPRWIDLNKLYARSKEIGEAAAKGKRL